MSELNDQEDLRYLAQFTELDVRNADFKDLAKRIRALAEEVSASRRAPSAEQKPLTAAQMYPGEYTPGCTLCFEMGCESCAKPQGEQHPDDIAVDRFAAAMKEKLAKKRAQGRGGWEDKSQCSESELSYMLIDHLRKGDPVDIGNFAMMLQQRGEKIVTAVLPDWLCELGRPRSAVPIDMILYCPNPNCGEQHIDKADVFEPVGECTCAGPDQCETCQANEELYREWIAEEPWLNPPHRSHLCHKCGCIWRPADVPTNGVAATQTKGKADTWDGKPRAQGEPNEFAEIEALAAQIAGMLPSQQMAHAAATLRKKITDVRWRRLFGQPRAAVPDDEEVADFLRLARFSDGWNSYTFNDFKAFRKREIERSEAEHAGKPE